MTDAYTSVTRAEYTPEPCPRCGSTDVTVDWLNVSTRGNPDAWLPGLHTCDNSQCPSRPQVDDIFG